MAHVAGIIGGSAFGVAKNARLDAVRVLDCTGHGTSTAIVAGIDWVTANHVSPAVANMSLGGGPDDGIDTAVRNSIASGVAYSIAAGNDGADASNYSPARVAEAMTIGATTSSDTRASYSNYGSVLDLFAPGDQINSDFPAGLSPEAIGCTTTSSDTAICSGTSMAAPRVAGVAALYLQGNPGADPGTIRNTIVAQGTANVVGNPGAGSPNILLWSGFVTGGGGGTTGRYKLDANGDCYWDPNDSGPDQCQPATGRYKLDANGNCYWDPNDSGPDQCTPTASGQKPVAEYTAVKVWRVYPTVSHVPPHLAWRRRWQSKHDSRMIV